MQMILKDLRGLAPTWPRKVGTGWLPFRARPLKPPWQACLYPEGVAPPLAQGRASVVKLNCARIVAKLHFRYSAIIYPCLNYKVQGL